MIRQMLANRARFALLGGACLVLPACSVSDGAAGAQGGAGTRALVRITREQSSQRCPAGGVRVDSGRDTNQNELLDQNEIEGTEHVCAGEPGADGEPGTTGSNGSHGRDGQLRAVSVSEEGPGAHCEHGGFRIDIGLDADADGEPDADAELSTSFVCNGANGSDARDGAELLVAVTEEIPGPNCPEGGKLVSYGLDTDADAELDAVEVQGSASVCHGNPFGNGSRGLVQVTPVQPGEACSGGGSRIDFGQDHNQNQVLDNSEVQGTRYVCRGVAGPNGSRAIFRVSAAGTDTGCFQDGKRVDFGVDANANQLLEPEEIEQTRYLCNGTPGSNAHSALLDITSEPAGAHCAAGGYQLRTGFDANGNMLLDFDEISGEGYVCDGKDGVDASAPLGFANLVRVSVEAAGAACPAGGKRLQFGLDRDADGNLDAEEVTEADFVCDGAAGGAGAAGADRASALVQLTPEAASAQCPGGGQRVETGRDQNRDQRLTGAEITRTHLLCNGRDGANGAAGTNGTNGAASLIVVSAEPAGAQCAAGGQRLRVGFDADANGALSNAEVADTRFVCAGATASGGAIGNAALSLLVTSNEPSGALCPLGGQRLSYGVDTNGNGSLSSGEISGSRSVCRGAAGAAGAPGLNALRALVVVNSEASGSACPNGGQRLRYGLDDDNNGELAAAEIEGTRYVCDGADGAPGSNGSNSSASGAIALVTVSVEPMGTHCGAGGQRVEAGLDLDGNTALSPTEITSISYVCDFAALLNGSFETGDYTGWSFPSAGSFGVWANLQDGELISAGENVFDFKSNTTRSLLSPHLPFTYEASHGARLAAFFQTDAGEHRMYQTVTVPPGATQLKWDLFYRNDAGFSETQSFAWTLRNPSTDAVVATLFKTTASTPTSAPFGTPFSADVTAYAGATLRLSFDAVIRSGSLPMTFDHIRFE